ncbi:unnamed protein product [Miscanthus lutarioriparius]|uniref:Uncharacterized protein n=1 Tax=Miscanthus lutarioriparius TaxID=422564 RepID=A0A811NVW9_9POAL|nr:unnamed protein product [Miscanthus lutarioriparius]
MEDLAASFVPYPHSAPLYLLYDAASIANASHGLVAPPPPPPLPLLDDDDDGFAFATTTTTLNGGGAAALRACASDVSAASFADELFRAGALLPLSLPPRLQRPAAYSASAGASAATSPTMSSSAASASCRSSRKHRGFDPFAAALEKVRRDGGAPAVRRARSLSPLRGAAAAAVTAQTNSGGGDSSRAAARRARKGKGRGVRHLLCRVLMASAAAAPKALWPRRKDGVSYRPGLLVCLGYGV